MRRGACDRAACSRSCVAFSSVRITVAGLGATSTRWVEIELTLWFIPSVDVDGKNDCAATVVLCE